MNKHISILIFLLSFLTLNIVGCSKSGTDYIPLDEGRSWTYSLLTTNSFGEKNTLSLTISNLEDRDLNGMRVKVQKSDINGQSSFAFYVEDKNGIAVVAKQSMADTEPIIFSPPRYEIKYPIVQGINWRTRSEAFLVSHNDTLILKSTIESISEVITIPIGSFKDCVKISRKGSIEQHYSEHIDVNEQDWYAPGIGCVKGIRTENITYSIGQKQAQIIYQLVSYKK